MKIYYSYFLFFAFTLISLPVHSAVYGYGADGNYYEDPTFVSAFGLGWILESDSNMQTYKTRVFTSSDGADLGTSTGSEGWFLTNTGATNLVLTLTTTADASYTHSNISNGTGTSTARARANMTVCTSMCYDNYWEHYSSANWINGIQTGSSSTIYFQDNASINYENTSGFEVELLIPLLVVAPGGSVIGYANVATEVQNAFGTSVSSDMYNTLQTIAVASHGNFTIAGGSDWITVNEVPVPAAAWLFCSALFALIGTKRYGKQRISSGWAP